MPRVIRTLGDVQVGDKYRSRSTGKVLTVSEVCLTAAGLSIRGTRPDKATPSTIVANGNPARRVSRRWTALQPAVERTNRRQVQLGDYALVNNGSRRRPDGLRTVTAITTTVDAEGTTSAFTWTYAESGETYVAKAKPVNDPIDGVFAGPAPAVGAQGA